MVRLFQLNPVALPTLAGVWTPGETSQQCLAEELAALAYPGFAYLRKRRPERNPAEVLLAALAQRQLEARVFEALPWLLLRYWEMDRAWVVANARQHNLQNRLGFVASLARKLGHRTGSPGDARDAALERLESALRESLLAREDTAGESGVGETERAWLSEHRCQEARDWNLVTAWRPELLRYAD